MWRLLHPAHHRWSAAAPSPGTAVRRRVWEWRCLTEAMPRWSCGEPPQNVWSAAGRHWSYPLESWKQVTELRQQTVPDLLCVFSSSPPPPSISCLPSSGLFWSLSIISASSAPAPPCVHMVPLSLSSHYTSFRQTLHLTLLSVSLPLFTALSISPPPPWRPPGSVNQTSVKNHVHMFMFSSVFSPSTRHQAPVCEKRFIHTWLCLLSQKDCVLVVGLNPQDKEVWHQSLTGRLCSLCST